MDPIEENTLEDGLLENDFQNTEIEEETKKTISDLKLPILALCFGVLTQGYLLISCFPYIAFMCIQLVPGLDEQNAGSYAGIMSTIFMLGRTLSSYMWNKIADKSGRLRVFYWSYILSIIFSIVFGMSTNIIMAIVARFFLGASNGLVTVVKTVCTEIAEDDRELEGKVMNYVFGTRGWGFLLSPIVGGYLSDPLKQFPDSFLSKTFPKILAKYPYLLPNVVGALLCSIGLVTTYFFVKETKPTQIPDVTTDVTMKDIWRKPATRDHLIAFWVLVFCSLAYDEAIPLFFISTKGGLSLEEKNVSNILAGSAFYYAFLQYLLYFNLRRSLGLYGTMKLSCLLGAPLAILTPISALLNDGEPHNKLRFDTWLFLILILGSVRIFSGVFFATSSLGANKSVGPEEIAAVSRTSMFGGSIAQILGPLGSGFLTSYALSSGDFAPGLAIYVTFSAVFACGSMLAVFTWIQLRKHHVD